MPIQNFDEIPSIKVKQRKIAIVESPFAAPNPLIHRVYKNYAKLCMYDVLILGYAPLLSHLLYPQVLRDRKESDRKIGIECCIAWQEVAHEHFVYTDFGESAGMQQAIDAWSDKGKASSRRFFTTTKGETIMSAIGGLDKDLTPTTLQELYLAVRSNELPF